MMSYNNKKYNKSDNEKSVQPISINKNRLFMREILVTISYSLLFCGVVVIPGIFIFTENLIFAMLGIFLLGLTAICVISRRVDNFFFFVFIHFGVSAGLFYIIQQLSKTVEVPIICAAFIIFSVSFSIMIYFSNGTVKLNGAFIAISAVFLILASYIAYNVTETMIDAPLSVIFVIIIACCLLFAHMENIDDALGDAAQHTVAPIESILKFNNKIVILIISIIVALVLLSRFLFVDKLLLFIYSCLDKLLYFIISRLPQGTEKQLGEIHFTEQDNYILPEISPFIAGAPVNTIGISNDIISVIVYVTSAVIIISIIAYLVYDLYKKYNDLPKANANKSTNTDVKSYVTAEDTALYQRARMNIPFFAISNREKARRMFFRKVNKYHNEGIMFTKAETAGEMSNKIKKRENIFLLENLYNKARYSDLEITQKDLEITAKHNKNHNGNEEKNEL